MMCDRRAEKPTQVTYIDMDASRDDNGEYTVRAPSPVTGGTYYIGVYGTSMALQVKEVEILKMSAFL
jgi:hypothetical protein